MNFSKRLQEYPTSGYNNLWNNMNDCWPVNHNVEFPIPMDYGSVNENMEWSNQMECGNANQNIQWSIPTNYGKLIFTRTPCFYSNALKSF